MYYDHTLKNSSQTFSLRGFWRDRLSSLNIACVLHACVALKVAAGTNEES